MLLPEPPAVLRRLSRTGAALRWGRIPALTDLPIIAPMLPSPARNLPAREAEWAAEAKWDGARAIVYVAGGTVFSSGAQRPGCHRQLPRRSPPPWRRRPGNRTLILDGELTVFGSGPSELRPAAAQAARQPAVPAPALIAAVPVTYIAFDLLWQTRSLLPGRASTQRRAMLDTLGLPATRST